MIFPLSRLSSWKCAGAWMLTVPRTMPSRCTIRLVGVSSTAGSGGGMAGGFTTGAGTGSGAVTVEGAGVGGKAGVVVTGAGMGGGFVVALEMSVAGGTVVFEASTAVVGAGASTTGIG